MPAHLPPALKRLGDFFDLPALSFPLKTPSAAFGGTVSPAGSGPGAQWAPSRTDGRGSGDRRRTLSTGELRPHGGRLSPSKRGIPKGAHGPLGKRKIKFPPRCGKVSSRADYNNGRGVSERRWRSAANRPRRQPRRGWEPLGKIPLPPPPVPPPPTKESAPLITPSAAFGGTVSPAGSVGAGRSPPESCALKEGGWPPL